MSGGLRWQDSQRNLYPLWSGGSGHKRISGVTKDPAGAILAGVTCKAFRTNADPARSLEADAREGPESVSDAGGNYECMVPNTDTHYVVSYKAGTPDVAGTTVNTLVGS